MVQQVKGWVQHCRTVLFCETASGARSSPSPVQRPSTQWPRTPPTFRSACASQACTQARASSRACRVRLATTVMGSTGYLARSTVPPRHEPLVCGGASPIPDSCGATRRRYSRARRGPSALEGGCRAHFPVRRRVPPW
eukprot:2828578-Rhodomonas_salina.2